MSRLESLKKAKSLADLAKLLGYKPKSLSYILYQIPDNRKYIEFEIPKKNDGKRKIKAPIEELKLLQRRLADLLIECFEKVCSIKKQKPLSHGFRKKYSIITNAKCHKNKRYVFNIDLQEFFPSINFGRVRGFFIKNRNFNLEQKVATIIAQISCNENELPQGSPCSPIISNLIGHLLDVKMANLSKKTKCTYSRYADDLTFSTNSKTFPSLIATINDKKDWIAGANLIRKIKEEGFKLNPNKTSMQFKTSRQMTTGLIVNKKVNIRKEYYKTARSMCHELFKSDKFFICEREKTSKLKEKKIAGTMNQLEGILNFIYQIRRLYFKKELESQRLHHPEGITKLYRSFLFYKHFFLTSMPLIICEGKTDIIYLECALKSLANDYTDLIKKDEDKNIYKIKFLNMTKTFKDVFAIPSGTSGLKFLLEKYENHMAIFKGSGKHFPVIMVIDNDNGAKEIKKKLKINSSSKSESFYYLRNNLYIVFIPEIEGKAIEDLFDSATLGTKVDGKVFNRNKDINVALEYGKIVFAEKVVRTNQHTINFDRFRYVFNVLRNVTNDYQKKLEK